MTVKERAKCAAKGIFTITQLSYGYRPRRRKRIPPDAKNSPKRRLPPPKNDFKLRALAIKKSQIHVIGAPSLKFEGAPIFLDVEGMPLALAQITAKMPASGTLIYGDGYRVKTVNVESYVTRTRQIIDKTMEPWRHQKPPAVVLNRHCAVCDFERRCKTVATGQDIYYLIGMRFDHRGMSEERSFWADSANGEREIWESCLLTLKTIENAQIISAMARVRNAIPEADERAFTFASLTTSNSWKSL
jgi:hypothetical protein